MRVIEKKTDVQSTSSVQFKQQTEKKKQTVGHKLFTLVLALCFLTGLGILLSRPIGVFITNRQHEAAIEEYIEAVNKLSDSELAEIRERAVAYNADYAYLHPVIWTETAREIKKNYPTELCVPGTDVIAYVEIPTIDVRLPIYHYASDESMTKGCGHLEGSSLPICGMDSHAFLFSHRNMMTAVTFEHLDKLKEGDTFSVTALKETATFKVDDIRVIDPRRFEDYGDMMIEEGKEYCTLGTCTPNGSTTHRLFVRGVRID